MNLIVGSDHGGFSAKEHLVKFLLKTEHHILDVGTTSEESMDYPDIAQQVARAVAKGKNNRGILVCGTGIGMAIAANKINGVRAAVVWNKKTASLAAEHNNANVLCLGGRMLTKPQIVELTKTWLGTPFGGNRHTRRINKITALEKGGF